MEGRSNPRFFFLLTLPISSLTAAVMRHLLDIVKVLAAGCIGSLPSVHRIHAPDALSRLIRHPRHALC